MEHEDLEAYDKRMLEIWTKLKPNAREVLAALCKYGPIWDGDVPSKSGRDDLLDMGLAAKIVMGRGWAPVKDEKGRQLEPKRPCGDMETGFQAATYKGANCYRIAVVEPRKDAVSKLVGEENVVRRGV